MHLLFYRIETSFLYDKNAPRGSHCGGMVSIVSNFNDLAGFGAFMVSLWGLLPDIVRGLILAVAALFVIIGVIQLID